MYHEKFATRRELAETLSEELDCASDEMTVYVDLTAQNVLLSIPTIISGESNAEYNGHEVVRMDRIDSHEAFRVMEDFARSRPEAQGELLFRALSRRGPFKMFRYALEDAGLLGDRIAPYTSRLVFSFVDIKAYAKVAKNLERGGITAREFVQEEMLEAAEGIAAMTREWKMAAGTCGELADLPGIEQNRCVDDRLMVKCFSHDAELMKFIGAKLIPGNPLFGEPDHWSLDAYRKDSGQRAACGCIMSKDIGEYNTCPHLCHYCYANANNAAALANWQQHLACPHAETITGR